MVINNSTVNIIDGIYSKNAFVSLFAILR